MNLGKPTFPPCSNDEYGRLSEPERRTLTRRDAAMLDALRGIQATLATMLRVITRSAPPEAPSDDRPAS